MLWEPDGVNCAISSESLPRNTMCKILSISVMSNDSGISTKATLLSSADYMYDVIRIASRDTIDGVAYLLLNPSHLFWMSTGQRALMDKSPFFFSDSRCSIVVVLYSSDI